MKSIVIYSSQSGNTKKLADGVAEELGCESIAVADAGDMTMYDLVAVGFWYKAGGPDPATMELLPALSGKKVFLFASHGAAVGTPPAENGMKKAVGMASGAEIVGTFSCPGEVSEKVLEMAANKDPQPPWLAAAPDAKGHPDESDISDVRSAVRSVV